MDIKDKLDKYMLLEKFHPMDNILDDITYDEIHTQVYSNIPKEKLDTKVVMKEFESLLKQKVNDARFLMRKAAAQIVKDVMSID